MLKPTQTVAAILAALFPSSAKAISEKLTQEEFNAFATDAEEVQNRLDAQTKGNEAVAADLKTAQADSEQLRADLVSVNTKLERANSDAQTLQTQVSTLQPKADAWDAHKAALANANVTGDSTNGKPGRTDSQLSEKDQKNLDEKARLKAQYPGLMAEFDVPVSNE